MSESTLRVDSPATLSDVDGDPVVRSPLYDPPTVAETSEASPLEQLRGALAAPVERELLRLRVPTRPGVTLLFDPTFTNDQRKAWQKRATKKSRRPDRPDETDEMLFSCLVIANTHRGVEFRGIEAHTPTGNPLTFAHSQLHEMVSAADPEDAIRKLFANDAHVLLASGEILVAAGFDDDLEAADPTSAS